MNLTGKIALVTGGSLGIGKAIAKGLIEKGAKVAITGRNKERLEAAAADLGAFPIQADAGDPNSVAGVFEALKAEFGGLDILVNNAGVGGEFQELENLTWENFEQVFRINVFGAAMYAKAAAEIFKANSTKGNIVNIGSTASLKGFARGTVYSASKFALRSMSQSWQAELRKHDIRVFQVNPSEVVTAFANDGVEREEVANKLRSQEIAHAIIGALEMDDRGFIPEFSVWATNPW